MKKHLASQAGGTSPVSYLSYCKDLWYSQKMKSKCVPFIPKPGRVKVINRRGHPLQKTWQESGRWDTAWVPPNCNMVRSNREENCIRSRSRHVQAGLSRANPIEIHCIKVVILAPTSRTPDSGLPGRVSCRNGRPLRRRSQDPRMLRLMDPSPRDLSGNPVAILRFFPFFLAGRRPSFEHAWSVLFCFDSDFSRNF